MSFCSFAVNAYALEDGAYTIGRETSYVNPETGETVDGGTNIALGDSMCASIVEDKMLVEQSGGKTYITIGIGLMSNIENVRIQVENENGEYENVDITKTGSCERDSDTCNHYRFEVPSAKSRISPIIYVTPMGRDVQFFVIPDVDSAKTGSGNFVSEMVTKKTETTQAETQSQTETQTKITTTQITTQLTTEITTEVSVTDDTENKKSSSTLYVVIGVIVTAAVVGAIVVAVKKKKADCSDKDISNGVES